MKICVLSDTHIDSNAWSWDLLRDCYADVAVFAGDVSNDPWITGSWLKQLKTWFPRVVWIAGNHDYYNTGFHSTRIYDPKWPKTPYTVAEIDEHYAAWSQAHGLDYVNRASVTIDGITFLGATGWHDFVAGAPTSQEEQVAAWYYLNDKTIKWTREERQSSSYAWKQSEIDAQAIGDLVAQATTPVVVLTHHIPRREFCWQKPEDRIWTALHGSFANTKLEAITDPKIAAWIYGHTHQRGWRTVNGIEYICNARGYPRENSHWEPIVIDIDANSCKVTRV